MVGVLLGCMLLDHAAWIMETQLYWWTWISEDLWLNKRPCQKRDLTFSAPSLPSSTNKTQKNHSQPFSPKLLDGESNACLAIQCASMEGESSLRAILCFIYSSGSAGSSKHHSCSPVPGSRGRHPLGHPLYRSHLTLEQLLCSNLLCKRGSSKACQEWGRW